MVNRNKLVFYSPDPIDKIVFPRLTTDNNEVTILNDGDTTAGLGLPNTAKIVELSIPNPYGRAALVRAVWSIDSGVNEQSLESRILYSFTFNVTGVGNFPSGGLDCCVSIGCSDNEIIFRTANGRHGDVTLNPGTMQNTYTPVSRTFNIRYWVYERE